MCGIIGYVGKREAAPILVEGLHRLEYRGYDSAGVAVQNGAGVVVTKVAGRVAALGELLGRVPVHGTSGIAHTRWATHGAPTTRNAHPHSDCSGTLALVHNGIIENADALRAMLERGGHRFTTETDTETLAHLIEEAVGQTLEARVIAALALVEGTYGLAVVSATEPGKIVVARQGSPVLLGIGDDELFVASDASAVLEHTRSVVYLDDGDIAVLTPAGYAVLDRESHVQLRAVDDVAWDVAQLELGGHAHFMLKEILEQPETIRATLRGRLLPEQGSARLNGLNLAPEDARALQRIVIVACGTGGGIAGGGDRQRGGEYHRARVRGRDLPARGPRGRRGVDQGVHVADRGAGAVGVVSRAGAGADGGARPGAGVPPDPAAAAGDAHPGARAGSAGAGGALRRRAEFPVPGAGREFPRRARGCPEAQGDLLHPCRGLPGGGDEARPDRADRCRDAGSVRGAAGSRLREGALEHAGGEGAGWAAHRGDDRGVGRPGPAGRASAARAGHRPAAVARADDDPAAAAGVPHRRAARLRRGPAAQPRQKRHRGVTAMVTDQMTRPTTRKLRRSAAARDELDMAVAQELGDRYRVERRERCGPLS